MLQRRIDPAWEVAGLGDYNIDTALDIVWRHATGGDVYLWLMGPGGTWQGAAFGTVPLDWSYRQIWCTRADQAAALRGA